MPPPPQYFACNCTSLLIGHIVVVVVVFVVVVLVHGHGRMVVQSLGHELQRQRILLTGGLLDLGALVLEPDLDLVLVQVQLAGQILAPLLRQVAVLGELGLEPGQLVGREGRARPLLLRFAVLLADASSART